MHGSGRTLHRTLVGSGLLCQTGAMQRGAIGVRRLGSLDDLSSLGSWLTPAQRASGVESVPANISLAPRREPRATRPGGT